MTRIVEMPTPDGDLHSTIAKGESVAFHVKVPADAPLTLHGQFSLAEHGADQVGRRANLSTTPGDFGTVTGYGDINPSRGFYTAPQSTTGKGGHHHSGPSTDPVFPPGSDVYFNVENDPNGADPVAAIGGTYGGVIVVFGWRNLADHVVDDTHHHKHGH